MVILALAAAARAQSAAAGGVISGTVTDAQGAAIPGAQVTVATAVRIL